MDGRLKRFYRDGKVVGLAFLDDYAYLTAGLLDLYEATLDAKWLSQAKGLAEQMIELFADPNGGGFYLSPGGGEVQRAGGLLLPESFAGNGIVAGKRGRSLVWRSVRLQQEQLALAQGDQVIAGRPLRCF